jgi:ATP-binding cassette subfamily C protein LapB
MIRQLISDLLKGRHGAALIGSTVTINVLALASSMYSIELLNRYVTVGLAPTLITLTVGVLFAIILEVSLRKERQKVLADLSRQNDENASARLFTAFATSRYEAMSALPLSQRREALGAPSTLQQLASTNNLGSLLDLPFALFFLFCGALLFWPMGIIGAAACALTLWLGVRGERVQRAAAEDHAKASSRSTQLGQFLLTAGETVRGLPMIGPLRRRWTAIQSESLGSRRSGMLLQANLQQSIATVGQLLTVMIYCVGAIAVVKGDLTTGSLIGANILFSRAFAVCSRAAYLADPILRANRANDALKAVEATELEPLSGASPSDIAGHLELFDVAFSYPKQPVPLFESLNLNLEPGKVMVITGPNGSGKSTLIKLMMGLLTPIRGMVRSDRIELRQLSSEWWRNHVGYAPQEPVFFDGSLRENLLLDREVDDTTIIAWVRDLGLDHFLAADPEGLDKQISSHDTGMAVGLRRRFLLIRAVIGGAKVVFLDDPTEGLDQAGQMAVAKLLNRMLTEGRTLVVASNEQFILRAADVVVDMGKKPTPEVKLAQRSPTPEADTENAHVPAASGKAKEITA